MTTSSLACIAKRVARKAFKMMKLPHHQKLDSIGILNQIQLLEDHMDALDWTITKNGLKVNMYASLFFLSSFNKYSKR